MHERGYASGWEGGVKLGEESGCAGECGEGLPTSVTVRIQRAPCSWVRTKVVLVGAQLEEGTECSAG